MERFFTSNVLIFLMMGLAACGPREGGAPVVSVLPQAPRSGDRLHVELLTPAVLRDGDSTETYRYRWYEGGEERLDLISDSVSSIYTVKGETWEVRVSAPSEPDAQGSASVEIRNTIPEVSVAFDPAEPSANDSVSVLATPFDEDGDLVTLSYSWTRDGVVTEETGDLLPAEAITVGDVWAVTVTPDDGDESGLSATASFTVANTAPNVDRIEILPEEPVTDSELVAHVTASDIDGDDLTFSYRWRVNGSVVQDGVENALQSALFVKGNFIDVIVTPDDGLLAGVEEQSNIVFIQNTPPEILGVRLNPENPTSSDSLMAIADGHYDADGDSVLYDVTWYVNGVSVPMALNLSPANFARGDMINAEMTGNDFEDTGPALSSDIVVVENSLPGAPDLAIEPGAPTVDEDLVCSIEVDSVDADGDIITYSRSWFVDGVDSGVSKKTLNASKTTVAEEWACRIVPNDGFGDGGLAEVSVEIQP